MLDNDPVVCQTADYAVPNYPRRAFADLTDSRCQLRVSIVSRTGTASPF